jgi:hypothetical protein
MGSFADLLAKRRTVTSQWGEDGILEEIFRRIGTRNRIAIELGAGDGKTLSNTWNLWKHQGWRAVLLEGDPERAALLRAEAEGAQGVHVVAGRVELEGERTLEALVRPFDVPDDLDLFSLDIDGDDWHLLAGLRRLRPRVLLVEFNPTIPPSVDVVQPRGEHFGASAKAVVRLGRERGWRLACLTETNVVLVRNEDFPALGFPEPTLEETFPDAHLTHVVCSFDGATFLTRTPSYLYRLRPRKPIEFRLPDPPHPVLAEDAGLIPVVIRGTGKPRP